jgi:hypothetical protein
VDAVAALDALALVDHADAVVVICDRADRAGLLTGTDQMSDRAVRASLRAHAALFTLVGINTGPAIADRDRAELTGIDAGFAHAETAVIRNSISGKRTFFAGRADYLNDVLRLRDSIRALRQGETDSLLDKFSLFVDTAAISCSGTGNDLIDKLFLVFLVQLAIPCKSGCLFHDSVFQSYEGSIIGYHIVTPFSNAFAISEIGLRSQPAISSQIYHLHRPDTILTFILLYQNSSYFYRTFITTSHIYCCFPI